MAPGETPFTRTCGANSTARLRVSEVSPDFAAQYALYPGKGRSAWTSRITETQVPGGALPHLGCKGRRGQMGHSGPPIIRSRWALLGPALRLWGSQQAVQLRQRGPAPCRCREITLSGWHISAVTRAALLPASYCGHLIAADKVTQPPSLAPPWGPVAAPLHARSLRASIRLPAPIIQRSHRLQ